MTFTSLIEHVLREAGPERAINMNLMARRLHNVGSVIIRCSARDAALCAAEATRVGIARPIRTA
jgi:hypothetical protein